MKRSSIGLISLIAILITWQSLFWFTTQFDSPTREQFIAFGAPYASEIYNGHFWGVITNCFLHVNLIHFAANIFLLLFFARRVERSYGSRFFLLFLLSAALVTSSIQLAMSGDAGIGLTGVNLAFLYFMLGDRESFWKWKFFQPMAMTLGGLTLLFALINLKMQWILLGFSAIISAIVFGYVCGVLHQKKTGQLTFIGSTCLLLLLSLVYNPFSSEWNTVKGYESFVQGDKTQARNYYKKALQLSEKNVVARKNLDLFTIDSLSTIAIKQHEGKQYDAARATYLKILTIDNNFTWAKENLKKLP